MCTLSIIKSNNQILITMNRDERIHLKEKPPQIFQQKEVQIITPIDEKSSGSWIGVNQSGIAACLLNRYETYSSNKQSRGEIIFKFLAFKNLEEISNFLQNEFKAEIYNPFILVLIKNSKIIRIDFDGSQTQIKNITLSDYFFVSSSSLKWYEVLAFRRQLFDKWQKNPTFKENIPTFHLPILGEDEQWTPFVKREKVHSKNICQIAFNKEQIQFTYYPFKQINQNDFSNCAPRTLKLKFPINH